MPAGERRRAAARSSRPRRGRTVPRGCRTAGVTARRCELVGCACGRAHHPLAASAATDRAVAGGRRCRPGHRDEAVSSSLGRRTGSWGHRHARQAAAPRSGAPAGPRRARASARRGEPAGDLGYAAPSVTASGAPDRRSVLLRLCARRFGAPGTPPSTPRLVSRPACSSARRLQDAQIGRVACARRSGPGPAAPRRGGAPGPALFLSRAVAGAAAVGARCPRCARRNAARSARRPAPRGPGQQAATRDARRHAAIVLRCAVRSHPQQQRIAARSVPDRPSNVSVRRLTGGREHVVDTVSHRSGEIPSPWPRPADAPSPPGTRYLT